MKKLISTLILLVSPNLLAEAPIPLPLGMLTLRVEDQQGNLLRGVPASIRANDEDAKYRQMGVTNQHGQFSASLPAFGSLSYTVGGGEYYGSWGQVYFNSNAMKGKPADWGKRKWEPWNPTVTVRVVKRGQGRPMLAKRISMVAFPVTKSDDGWGYDLEVGDFTPPFGKGKAVDLLFRTTGALITKDYSISISAPGIGNGLLPVVTRENYYSEFDGPTAAPESGYAGPLRINEDVQLLDRDKNERLTCIVFRCRTTLDGEGRVMSARYGKIYPERYNLAYYLNPEVNERGLEFDTNRNLLTLPARLGLITRP